jgi:Fe-S-cluster containining protein
MPKSQKNHLVGQSADSGALFVKRGQSIYKTMEPSIVGHESEVRVGKSKEYLETHKDALCSPELQARIRAWQTRADKLGITCRDCGACCISNNGAGLIVNVSKADEPFDKDRINAIRPLSLVCRNDECVMAFIPVDEKLEACPFWHKEQGCTIYNERPRVCKTFTAGNWACLRVRAVCLPHLDRAHLMSDKERAFYKKHESKRNWARWMTLD